MFGVFYDNFFNQEIPEVSDGSNGSPLLHVNPVLLSVAGFESVTCASPHIVLVTRLSMAQYFITQGYR